MSTRFAIQTGIEVDTKGVNAARGAIASLSTSVRELSAAEEKLAQASRNSAAARASRADQAFLNRTREETRALAEAARASKQGVAAVQELARAKSAAASVRSAGFAADPGLEAKVKRQMELQGQLRQRIEKTIETQRQADRVASAIEAEQARTAALRSRVEAAKQGAEALRQLAEAQAAADRVAATGAAPGSNDAAMIEREVAQQNRLQEELREIAAARERDAEARREAARIQQRIDEESTELQRLNSILQAKIQATRTNAEAIRLQNREEEVSNRLHAVGARMGTENARVLEQEVRANIALREKLEAVNAARGRVTSAVGSIRNAIFNLRSAAAALGLGVLVHQGVDTALAMDRAQRSLVAVTGSLGEAGRETERVRAESERLGLVFTDTVGSYARLAASSKATALEGAGMRDVFSATAEAAAVMGLSAADTDGVLRALQQMISKGTVQAEELRMQLGDRLPGAVQIMARALGVSTRELGKMMEGSKVMAADALPKFAAELRRTFGPGLELAVKGAQANLNRLRNDLDLLRASFGRGFLDSFMSGLAGLREGASSVDVGASVERLGQQVGGFASTAASAVAGLVKNFEGLKAIIISILALKLAAFFTGLVSAIRVAGGVLAFFNTTAIATYAALGPLAILIGAVTYAWSKYRQEQALAAAQQEQRRAEIAELTQYLSTLRARTEDLTRAERELADQRKQSLMLDRAEALKAIAEARDTERRRGIFIADPEEYERVLESTPRVAEARARYEELNAALRSLNTELARVATLPNPDESVPDIPDDSAEKISKIIEKYRIAAEQSEQLRQANERGASAFLETSRAIEVQSEALEAVTGLDKASAAQKQNLIAIITPLILLEQQNTIAIEEVTTARDRQIDVDQRYREALAALTDARNGDREASLALSAQLKAEAAAREQGFEADQERIAALAALILAEDAAIARILREVAAVESGIEVKKRAALLEAELADAIDDSTAATKREIDTQEVLSTLRSEGIKLGTAEAAQREKQIRDAQRVRDSTQSQVNAVKRWLDTIKEVKQAEAELADGFEFAAAAREYGQGVAEILQQNDQLSTSTRQLTFETELLNRARADGLDLATEAGRSRLAQLREELQAQTAAVDGVKKYRAEAELAAHVNQPILDAWQETKATIADVVTDLVTGVKVEWGEVLRQMLQMWVRTLIEMQIRARAVKLAANVSSGGGGGGGGGVSSSTGQISGVVVSNAGSFAGLSTAAWGAIAGFAILAVGLYIQRNRTNLGRFGNFAQVTDTGDVANLSRSGREALSAVRDLMTSLKNTVNAASAEFKIATVQVSKDGDRFRVQIDSVFSRTFRSYKEAFDFAVVESFKRAEFGGLTAEMAAVLRNTKAQTVEEFQRDLEAGKIAEGLRLGDFGVQVLATGDQVDDLRERLLGLGLDVALVEDMLTTSFQDWRDRLLGVEQDANSKWLREIDQYNQTRLEQERKINAQIADAQSKMAEMLGATYDKAVALANKLSESGQATAEEIEEVLRQLQGSGDSAVQSSAAFKLLQEIIESLRRQLEALPAPIDPTTAKPPKARGGGRGPSRRERREDFEGELRDIIAAGLPDEIQRVRALAKQIEELGKKAKETGADAALLAEAVAALREAERARYDEIVKEATRPKSLTGFRESLREIAEKYARLREANEEALRTTGQLIEARWKLTNAEKAELAVLGKTALERLNAIAGTDSFASQLAETVELIKFLRQNLEALAISEAELLAARDRAAQSLLLSVAESLARAAGNEAELKRIAEIRWKLEKAAMLQQIQLLEAQAAILGLSQEDIQHLRDLYNSLPDAPPVAPDVPGGGGGGSPEVDPAVQAIQEALRLLEQYEEAAALAGLSEGQRRLRQIESDFEIIFRAMGRNTRTMAAYQAALDELHDSLLEQLRDIRDELTTGGLSGGTLGGQVDALRSQATALYEQFRTGTEAQRVAALEQLPDVLRSLLQAGQEAYGGGVGFLALRQFVLAMLEQLGISSTIPGTGNPNTSPGGPSGEPPRTGTSRSSVLLAGGAFLQPVRREAGQVDPALRTLAGKLEKLTDALERKMQRDSLPDPALDVLEEIRDASSATAKALRPSSGVALRREARR